MILWSVISLVVLLLLSALFSSLETAFTSLTPGQITTLLIKDEQRGKLVKKLTGKPEILLTTLLIGNNLANLVASAISTAITIYLFGNTYIAIATGILTLTILIFCEVTPKQIALVANEKLCLRSARTIIFLSWIFRPFIWLIAIISKVITRITVGHSQRKITLEHLLHHIKAAENAGIVQSHEEEMVRNVFRTNDMPVEAIMTHRTDLFLLYEDNTIQEALDGFLKSGHSRAPLVKKNHEQVCGVVSLLDVISAVQNEPNQTVKRIAQSPYLVPSSMKAYELFFRLNRESIHLAVVLDEYGGLNGVVSREDVMEEIFGELYDEKEPRSSNAITAEAGGKWIIPGNAAFHEIMDELNLNLSHDNRTHTIGGYLFEKLESIPSPGTRIDLPEGSYTILATKKKRITSVCFQPKLEDKN